jgi:flagellar protein FlaF
MTTGYAKSQEASLGSGPPQLTESWALTTAARKMLEAKERPDDIDGLTHAVRINWRLWTIFQAELTEPTNTIPAEIRGNLLSLAAFIDKQSTSILGDPKAEKLDVLININRQIAAGLAESGRRQQEAEAATRTAAPPQTAGVQAATSRDTRA